MHPERIQALNDRRVQPGEYVLYWMQSSQRTTQNEALQAAIIEADELRLPVLVCFGLTSSYPSANWRHYRFLLEGLQEVAASLRERGIAFALRTGHPPDIVAELGQRATLTIIDRGYLRHHTQWYHQVAQRLPCPLLQVESNIVVPLSAASHKEEYAARTIRPKIHRRLLEFLTPLKERWPRVRARGLAESLDLSDLASLEDNLQLDRSVPPSPSFRGGQYAAQRLLEELLTAKLTHYADARNDPAQDGLSHLSPYLHFGQISPRQIALAVRERGGNSAEVLIEELVVRRELAINYCAYNPHYDSLQGLPNWAINTLNEHADDPRPYLYTLDQLEAAATHDAYWNAAQREMTLTGKMHGYMRMYWGKKVLEWSASPFDALASLVHLNDKYELDGRDPNGYAGIAWCFGKHDRPWKRRPILGTVRYMSAAGLERKFDVSRYLARIDGLQASLSSEKRSHDAQ